ncbi:hypothetical protein [Legionella sp. W05-934-2]|uniref:hypothetical protein n=1 Tax=Legionella sp. W05-934-2 TaxID=1198649 RepID=UPI0034622466
MNPDNTILDNSDFYSLVTTIEQWFNKVYQEAKQGKNDKIQLRNELDILMKRIFESEHLEELMEAKLIIKPSADNSDDLQITLRSILLIEDKKFMPIFVNIFVDRLQIVQFFVHSGLSILEAGLYHDNQKLLIEYFKIFIELSTMHYNKEWVDRLLNVLKSAKISVFQNKEIDIALSKLPSEKLTADDMAPPMNDPMGKMYSDFAKNKLHLKMDYMQRNESYRRTLLFFACAHDLTAETVLSRDYLPKDLIRVICNSDLW